MFIIRKILEWFRNYDKKQQDKIPKYLSGKNPSYPNNNSDGTPNPLNPNLDLFGANLSILVSTYYIPADKVAISPYKERF